MKKIFTMIAAAFMAVSAQAQTLTFDEATSSTGTFGSGDFIMTTAGWDGANNAESTRYFGTADNYVSAKGMIRAGNKIDGSTRSLTIKSTYGGTVKFYMCTSSSTAERDVTVNGQTKKTSKTTAADNAERAVYGILEFDINYGETAMTTSGDVYIYKVEFASNGTVAPAEKPTLLTYTIDENTPTTVDEGSDHEVTIALDNGKIVFGNETKIFAGNTKLQTEKTNFTQSGGFKLDGGPAATGTKYVLISLNTNFQAGDEIELIGFCSGDVTKADYGFDLYADRAGESKVASTEKFTVRYANNTVTYKVVEGDNLIGKNTLYIYRQGSNTDYFFSATVKGEKDGRTPATTGIQTVKAQNAADGIIYNLAGQKVGKDYKGVVIMNGKKVVLK